MEENKFDTLSGIIVLVLVALDCALWYGMISFSSFASRPARAYFLDVGQGDSEMMIFPGDVKIMTDAGPDATIVTSLGNVVSSEDTYIDLAIVSHPQLDHFNGYNYILDHYDVGAFIYNGRDDTRGVKEWPALLAKIKAKRIPLITLGARDIIHYGASSNEGAGEIDFLSPNKDFDSSAELNDTGFVELVKAGDLRVLLTADIGFNVEDFLLTAGYDIHADILKVPHHGSRFSSGDKFLRAVDPRLAAIEVGAHNTYGHPSKDALARFASSTRAFVVRTDRNGTIQAWKENGKLRILKEKQ